DMSLPVHDTDRRFGHLGFEGIDDRCDDWQVIVMIQDGIVDQEPIGQVWVVSRLTLKMGYAIAFLWRMDQKDLINPHGGSDDLHIQCPFIAKAWKQLRDDLLRLLADPFLKGGIIRLYQL